MPLLKITFCFQCLIPFHSGMTGRQTELQSRMAVIAATTTITTTAAAINLPNIWLHCVKEEKLRTIGVSFHNNLHFDWKLKKEETDYRCAIVLLCCFNLSAWFISKLMNDFKIEAREQKKCFFDCIKYDNTNSRIELNVHASYSWHFVYAITLYRCVTYGRKCVIYIRTTKSEHNSHWITLRKTARHANYELCLRKFERNRPRLRLSFIPPNVNAE